MLERRAARRYDAESLALAGSLLEQNPETYTAWNFRREALQAVLQVCSSDSAALLVVLAGTCSTACVLEREHTTLSVRARESTPPGGQPLPRWLQGDSGAEEARRAAEDELALTERCLRRNPKSYAAWFHRRWVVQHGHCALDRELGLIDKCAPAPLTSAL